MKKVFALAAVVALVSFVQTSRAQTGGAASISALYPYPTPDAPGAAATNYGAGTYTLTGTVTAILNTGASSTSFLISDGTGSALAYNINTATLSTPTVGENITGLFKDSPYQDAPELITVATSTFAVNSTNNSVSATKLTVPQFLTTGYAPAAGAGSFGVYPNAESLVELDNVSLEGTLSTGYAAPTTGALATNYTYLVTDGAGTASFFGYKTDNQVLAAVNAANANDINYSQPVNVIGYADEYFGNAEIYPLSITQAVSTAPEPTSIALIGSAIIPFAIRRRRRTA